MKRAERRRQERRIKRRWVQRLRGFKSRTEPADVHERWVQKFAPRLAHHNKCDCGQCTAVDQGLDRAANRRERHEQRLALRGVASGELSDGLDDCFDDSAEFEP